MEEVPDEPQMELVSILEADQEPEMTRVTCRAADLTFGESDELIILLQD